MSNFYQRIFKELMELVQLRKLNNARTILDVSYPSIIDIY